MDLEYGPNFVPISSPNMGIAQQNRIGGCDVLIVSIIIITPLTKTTSTGSAATIFHDGDDSGGS